MKWKCRLGFHSWVKQIHSGSGLMLYGQKECLDCGIRATGYTANNPVSKWGIYGRRDK